jgi:hypothetical protein
MTLTGNLKPAKHGRIYFHYSWEIEELGRKVARATSSESGMHWFVFPAATTDEELKDWMNENGIEHDPVSGVGDCTGRQGTRKPCIRRSRSLVLVTWMWYTDI